jgi:hypothetical protein
MRYQAALLPVPDDGSHTPIRAGRNRLTAEKWMLNHITRFYPQFQRTTAF